MNATVKHALLAPMGRLERFLAYGSLWMFLALWALPPGIWFRIDTFEVMDAPPGETLIIYDRTIRFPFPGRYDVTIWDAEGVIVCNAGSPVSYSPSAKLPRSVTLDWWTDGDCGPLPEGTYRIRTVWENFTIPMFTKRVAREDTFIVTPPQQAANG